jgi:hypothetical protein
MAKAAINPGCIVVRKGLSGFYKVIWVSGDGKRPDIQHFDISNQKPLGPVLHAVAVRSLAIHDQDVSGR